MKGQLIVFEGIDGSGKSTQARRLYHFLRNRSVKCVLFREPGGTEVATQIRHILLNSKEKSGLDPITEILLFIAARRSLVTAVIKPYLEGGEHVILDRFTDSTIAYQGWGRGTSFELINTLNAIATDGIVPDTVFLMDIEPQEALNRIKRGFDRMENSGLEFYNRVRQGYLEIAKSNTNSHIIIDAGRTLEEVFNDIVSNVNYNIK